MEFRTLDLTVASAEDLKKVTYFSKMQPFAVAWVDPFHRLSTRVDTHGGSNPSWNQRLSFSLPEHFFQQPGSRLNIEVYSKGSLFGNKFVGAATIPLSELTQQSNSKELMMYQLRRRSGKVKGAVRLSAQIGEKVTTSAQTGYPGVSSDPVMAYPFDNQRPPQNYYPQPPYQPAYPPQQQYQPYPPQGYYPQQQFAPPPRRPGMMGGMGGMGTGLLAGALGGLIVGEMIDDAFDHDGGYNGGGYDGGGFGGFDGGGFDGGGFDGGF